MRLTRAGLLLVSIWMIAGGGVACAEDQANPSGFHGYQTKSIEGWTVHVSEEVMEEGGEGGERLLEVLRTKLTEVSKVLPERRVKFLRSVLIWIEHDDQTASPIVYHRSDQWLRRSGRNPAKVRGIEFCNVKRALFRINRQPMVILHELSHAYHHQELGLDEKIVTDAYEGAMKDGLYAKVKTAKGVELVPAYATKNAEEYFAELTEAYFGKNDYFPFTRSELKKHDPDGYLMVSRLWLLR